MPDKSVADQTVLDVMQRVVLWLMGLLVSGGIAVGIGRNRRAAIEAEEHSARKVETESPAKDADVTEFMVNVFPRFEAKLFAKLTDHKRELSEEFEEHVKASNTRMLNLEQRVSKIESSKH